MKMRTLLATQPILLANWVIVPVLGISIWIVAGFMKAILAFTIWVILDKIWDWLTGVLFVKVGCLWGNQLEVSQMENVNEVPGRGAAVLLMDLLGTLILPWIIAGFFLGWFSATAPAKKADMLSRAATEITQNLWWKSEYPALVKMVSGADSSSLETSYRSGEGGLSQVKLALFKTAKTGLMLKVKLPREGSSDNIAHEVVICDNNSDGLPDDFKIDQSSGTLYREDVSGDGFIKFRNHPEHQSILMLWSGGIGFSINHFLHGIDSMVEGREGESAQSRDRRFRKDL